MYREGKSWRRGKRGREEKGVGRRKPKSGKVKGRKKKDGRRRNDEGEEGRDEANMQKIKGSKESGVRGD